MFSLKSKNLPRINQAWSILKNIIENLSLSFYELSTLKSTIIINEIGSLYWIEVNWKDLWGNGNKYVPHLIHNIKTFRYLCYILRTLIHPSISSLSYNQSLIVSIGWRILSLWCHFHVFLRMNSIVALYFCARKWILWRILLPIFLCGVSKKCIWQLRTYLYTVV